MHSEIKKRKETLYFYASVEGYKMDQPEYWNKNNTMCSIVQITIQTNACYFRVKFELFNPFMNLLKWLTSIFMNVPILNKCRKIVIENFRYLIIERKSKLKRIKKKVFDLRLKKC